MRSRLLLLALPILVAAARPGSTPRAKTSSPAPALTGGAATLAAFNLAPLWQMSSGSSEDKVHNGFMGHNYRRLEMVFTTVQRDEKNPAIYHVQGKNRRFNTVRAFSGAIVLRDLQRVAPVGDKELADGWEFFTTKGQFTFIENAKPGDAACGTFRGELTADLNRNPAGHLLLNLHTTNEATRHGGFLLEGSWTAAASKARIDVLVKNGVAVTRQVLQQFELGGRVVEINPRYTRVGWDRYWSNEEWWADKPVAQR